MVRLGSSVARPDMLGNQDVNQPCSGNTQTVNNKIAMITAGNDRCFMSLR